MIRWKYISISSSSSSGSTERLRIFLEKINEKGMKGWELVSFFDRNWSYEGIMKKKIIP